MVKLLNFSFRLGTIVRNFLGNGISISHSKSFFMDSMESSVVEKKSLANFVFLLSGELDLKTSGCNTWQNMSQEKAYVFFSEDGNKIQRRINGKVSTEALIIKIPRDIFKNMVSDVGGSYSLLNRGTRCFSRKMSAHDTMLCNSLASFHYKGQTGRVIRMGRSLELVACIFLQGTKDVRSEFPLVLEVSDYIKK
ncbi:MAG: hypothetical protein CSA18_03040, partial [Deltaproteobacteria bacterium]